MSSARINADIAQATIRLKKAAQVVAALIDSDIDPPWADSQELENAAIDLGRLLNARVAGHNARAK